MDRWKGAGGEGERSEWNIWGRKVKKEGRAEERDGSVCVGVET